MLHSTPVPSSYFSLFYILTKISVIVFNSLVFRWWSLCLLQQSPRVLSRTCEIIHTEIWKRCLFAFEESSKTGKRIFVLHKKYCESFLCRQSPIICCPCKSKISFQSYMYISFSLAFVRFRKSSGHKIYWNPDANLEEELKNSQSWL